ncbi:MAG: hypothetical protein ACYDAD_12780 [Acidimicrobiales bacterium]
MFSIARNDKTTATQSIAITVTQATPVHTAAPDLVSAVMDPATGNVTYTFDQTVGQFGGGAPGGNSGSPTPAARNFHVYQASGTEVTAASVSISGKTVVATYPAPPQGGPSPSASATLATVTQDAVEDPTGKLQSPECGVALHDVASPGGVPATPNLIGAALSGTGTALNVAYTFDKTTAPGLQTAAFRVVLSDDTVLSSSTPGPAATSDLVTYNVPFTLPKGDTAANVVRAGIIGGVVHGTSGAASPRETLSTNAGGMTTNGPDLVGVAVQPALSAADFTFDKPVNAPKAGDNFSFRLYLNDGSESQGISTPVALSATVLRVAFGPGALAGAVGASVDSGAATIGSGANAPTSQIGSLPLAQFSIPAGATPLPDLVSATRTAGMVTFAFDKPFPSAQLAGANFQLYDANAVPVSAAVNGTIRSTDPTLVDFAITSAQQPFAANKLAGAVAAGVHDSTQNGTPPGAPQNPGPSPSSGPPGGALIPEGCASLS